MPEFAPLRPSIREGSRIAIVSPASAAQPELAEQGRARLKAFGYRAVVMPHALDRGPLYLAGSAADRAKDIHDAFADPSIDGILCTRGGWGSAELLPLLDQDLIRANPKAFVGYSDHTSLHIYLWNLCRLTTFYAPMVAADWSNPDGVDERTWRAALEAELLWSVGPSDGIRILRPARKAGSSGAPSTPIEGRILGGCLSLLTESLGTPYAFNITEPAILFLEDVNTKPYQWHRMIHHLRLAGQLHHVCGVILGDPASNIPTSQPLELALLEAACLHAFDQDPTEFSGPIAIGLHCGHVQQQNRSIPLGAWVRWSNDTIREIPERKTIEIAP